MPILIYDSKCIYCRSFKGLLESLDTEKKLKFWSYYSGMARKLLKAQFGEEYGFTLYLFTDQKVYMAKEAVNGSFKALGIFAFKAYLLYPAVAHIVSLLTNRQKKVMVPGNKNIAAISANAKKLLPQNI